ncbi:LacI family DNA-binding transcriptional regulator [Sinomicrobium sp.]
MKKKTSLKDIAREAGVSVTLVSYVLNGKNIERINADTATRIREVASKLNYTPNFIAKSLKKNKTYTLGLIIADISNLFYSSIARIIEDKAQENNYNMIFGSADENMEKFKGLVDVFLRRQVDGIILAAPAHSEETLKYLSEQRVPFVLIDRFFPSIDDASFVVIDNFKASYKVAEHLHDNQFKHPVMITLTSELHHLRERSRGFEEGGKHFFGDRSDYIITVEEEKLSGEIEKTIKELIYGDRQVDALYFSTNKIAMEGLAAIAKFKIKVPDQLGVVCFDEADAYRIFNTSITYVKQPLKKIGDQVVKTLLNIVEGSKEVEHVVFNTKIISGESSER